MAVKYKGKLLLNPYEKGNKAFAELKDGVHYTNDGKVKCNRRTGKPIRLTDTEKAYRSGYLAAQKDSRRVYKSRQNKNMPIIYIGD